MSKKSPTFLVVGGLIGAALIATAFAVAGLKGGLILTALLVYEGWTLVNSYANDTISEVIWIFAERPMVPFIFGVGCGWAVTSGFITNPWLLGSIMFLMGHFFFQRYQKEKNNG